MRGGGAPVLVGRRPATARRRGLLLGAALVLPAAGLVLLGIAYSAWLDVLDAADGEKY